MESRMEKYHDVDIEEFQRSKKNAGLYKEVYGNYDDFENLPIPENTNEIDIENLKSLVGSRASKRKEFFSNQDNFLDEEIIETPKEEKIYDINELLEIAKEENAKIKKEIPVSKSVPNYLANLESDKNTKDIILKYDGDDDDDLPIVSNSFYSTSKINLEEGSDSSSDLSLDILSDLKPNGDTTVSAPIKNEEYNTEELLKEKKEFFDGKLDFSNEDFDDDEDDEFHEEKNHLFLKVLLLIVGLASILTALFFVIKEYTNIFK